jgi:hypothetical protein
VIRPSSFALALGALVLLAAGAGAQPAPESWLDRPLTGWNNAGAAVPQAPTAAETTAAIVKRCRLAPPRSTHAEQALDGAGWIPFWNVDQQLVKDDVEIVGGMRAADAMCTPAAYNLFVFIGGQFAGTLSPVAMTSQTDGASGIVRTPLPVVTSEFARYKNLDALCCPSSRVTVRYRIDRTPAGPVIVPVELRTTRQ